MPANAPRAIFQNRQPFRVSTLGPEALTTTPQIVLAAQVNGDTRWVNGGSTVNNYTDPDNGGGPARYTLYYAPTTVEDAGDLTDEMIVRTATVDGDDFHQLGEFPCCQGFQLWASASANDYLNITIFTEDVE